MQINQVKMSKEVLIPIYLFSRATKDYTIAGSLDGTNWTQLAQGTLDSPYAEGCDQELTVIPVGNQEFRYLLFTAVNYYNLGPGLHYLNVQ